MLVIHFIVVVSCIERDIISRLFYYARKLGHLYPYIFRTLKTLNAFLFKGEQ